MPQLFDVTAYENARYKRNELEYKCTLLRLIRANTHCAHKKDTF